MARSAEYEYSDSTEAGSVSSDEANEVVGCGNEDAKVMVKGGSSWSAVYVVYDGAVVATCVVSDGGVDAGDSSGKSVCGCYDEYSGVVAVSGAFEVVYCGK